MSKPGTDEMGARVGSGAGAAVGRGEANAATAGAKASDMGEFVHLHLHTEYSLLDGGNQIEKLVARLAELGFKACGMTDHGNIFGAVQFYQACKDKGIKPILGVEAYVTPPGKPRTDRTYSGGGEGGFHLVLLAMNMTGWRNLMYLCSEAFLTGFYYKPRIDRELLEKHSEGLIAINGHLGSEIGDHLLSYHRSGDDKHWAAAEESAAWHARVFGAGSATIPRFYVELQHHVPEQNAINPLLIKLARAHGLPLVCDNDAHFLKETDYDAHDTLICISTGKNKRDDNRMRYPRDLFVKSAAEMHELFGPYGDEGREALANTVRIAEACNLDLPVGANHAPQVRVRRRGRALAENGAGREVAASVGGFPSGRAEADPWADLPAHDDPKFGGDLTAWYQSYCDEFEVVPFALPDGLSDDDRKARLAEAKAECDTALRRLSEAGYVWRYGPTGAQSAAIAAQEGERRARLERELKILADKNISAYFLIVWDFVNWGRANRVPANARGSGVGTMAGYVLGLSNACPVRYGLLFERFTDPDRSEYPDIDIDLCQDGRQDVINYVRNKYGHVAQIITFGTLKARAALKDVARVLGVSLPIADRVCKLIPEQLNITIEEALDAEPELKGLYEGASDAFRKINDKIGPEQQLDPETARQLIDNAIALEGHTRHAGVHAAGVIVATRPLHEIVPLYKPSGSAENEIITQWDGPTCEKMGLLKMDFLGLRTISVVERAKRLIREGLSEGAIWAAVGRGAEFESLTKAAHGADPDQPESGSRHRAHPLDLDRLSFADPRVFEMFARGDTTGVFQFESGGMRRLLVEMKPDRLEDLIAANALFRPGPMDLIPDYNRRKHGTEEVPKVHDIVDRYTGETYGVMVYQEQVMQIVHGLGGIKLRDAYSLIKNISKKKHDKIEKERPKFIDGAVRQGLTKDGANELFELILKFAGYGFNKSHSTGYAIVAYQTAYLKTYFPAQYMAAFLTYESQANKVSDWIPYMEDCRRARVIDPANGAIVRTGIEIRPPDISLSQADFTVVFDDGEPHDAQHGHMRFGLRAIKGTGDKAIESIMEERARNGPFSSLFDFCERMPPGTINKATLESLIKCGAFDSLHGREDRAAMVATIEQAINAGARMASDRAAGQGGLFGLGGSSGAGAGPKAAGAPTPLARVTPWNETETLTFEKEVLGFYVSSHPLDRWKAWYSAFATHTTASIKECRQDERVVVAAMVNSVRTLVIKNGRSAGQKMAILTVEDLNGQAEAVAFSEVYGKYGHLAEPEKVVFVLGRIDLSRGDPQIMVDRLVPIDGVPLDQGRMKLFVDETRLNGGATAALGRAAETLRIAAERQVAKRRGEDGPALFPVEIVIGTETHVAAVLADGKYRVSPEPELVAAVAGALGEGMVRVIGTTVEKVEKPKYGGWKKRGEDD